MNYLVSILFSIILWEKFLKVELMGHRIRTFLKAFESSVFQKGVTNYTATNSF